MAQKLLPTSDARRAYSDETSWEPSSRLRTPPGWTGRGLPGSDQVPLQDPSKHIWNRKEFRRLGGKPLGEALDMWSLETKSRAVYRVAETVMQEDITRFAMQAAEATNTLAIFGRLYDKAKVDRNTSLECCME
jgi:hypothetical protein